MVALADPVTVPLVVLWPTGVSSPAVQRVRAAMSSPVAGQVTSVIAPAAMKLAAQRWSELIQALRSMRTPSLS